MKFYCVKKQFVRKMTTKVPIFNFSRREGRKERIIKKEVISNEITSIY